MSSSGYQGPVFRGLANIDRDLEFLDIGTESLPNECRNLRSKTLHVR